MKRIRISAVVLAGALLFPATAFAQQGNRAERARDGAEIVDDHRDLAKDRRDRRQIIRIAGDWNQAVKSGNKAKEKAADARLKGWLVDELIEANKEVRETKSEVRASRREKRRSKAEAAHPGGSNAKDVHDLRDDRRDLRDDRRDRADAQIDRARLHKTVSALKAMQPRFENNKASRADYKRKKQLLASLVQFSNQEIRDEKRELREDRRERREDRRERREDRRGGY